LIKSEEKYKILFDNINDAAFLFRIDGEKEPDDFLEVNDKACELLNYSKEELMSLNIKNIHPPEVLPRVFEIAKKVLEQGSHVFEIELITKDGKYVTVEVSARIYNINNETYALSLVRDISERVKRRREREYEVREKSLFMDIISHDLKNYLSAGIAYLESAEFVSDNIDTSMQNVLNKTKSSILRSSSLLNNLAIMLKEDTNQEIRLSKQNISNIVNESIISLHELFPDKEIEITIEKTLVDLFVSADNLIVQLILNLLTNAVKYNSKNPKKIEISCEKTLNNTCICSINDYGKGIHPDIRKEIFTRFSKISNKSGGTGLGLFIVKKLIDRYNGKIWVESRDETNYKKGSIFKIELNLA
ncbi:MAG: PAS domain S-box protein, partial [Candidatus Heimdallarchaeota archaeon]|nr:PAS domain S-box protein [Candidatus Heimdallarchaeota archaeon]MCK4253624.1 PAS domain S-box protein [Candidatus Heimdallarchaeota archaeon]